METWYTLTAQPGRDINRLYDSPEWRHRVAILSSREPRRRRFMRHVRQLKALASQPWPSWEQAEHRP